MEKREIKELLLSINGIIALAFNLLAIACGLIAILLGTVFNSLVTIVIGALLAAGGILCLPAIVKTLQRLGFMLAKAQEEGKTTWSKKTI